MRASMIDRATLRLSGSQSAAVFFR